MNSYIELMLYLTELGKKQEEKNKEKELEELEKQNEIRRRLHSEVRPDFFIEGYNENNTR